MKKIAILLVSATVAMGVVSPVLADTSPAANNIAVINVADILQNSSRVQALNMQIRDKFQPQQVKLAAEDKSIQEEQAKLQRDGSIMSADQKKELTDSMNKDKQDFVKNASLFQQNLSAARDDAMKEVVTDLNAQIAKVAKAQGYSMVLFSQAVAYAGNAADITKPVADAFNSEK